MLVVVEYYFVVFMIYVGLFVFVECGMCWVLVICVGLDLIGFDCMICLIGGVVVVILDIGV